ncbi:hypothetical protein [Mesorhizobium sp. M0408]|uniref:hypothetical protein n=1 Tax=Mesorhizobium sp. M0408 TaxID=2956942 RepID=UPI00333CB5EC
MFDRGRLSVDALYEVEHFARENGVLPSQVSKLIKKNGKDRLTLTKAVKSARSALKNPPHSTARRVDRCAEHGGVGAGVGCARCDRS